MTAAQIRLFGVPPFSLKVWPKRWQESWPNFKLLDARGKTIFCGSLRTESLHALTEIVFHSRATPPGQR